MSHAEPMDCPWCDAPTHAGARQCPHCGRELTVIGGQYAIESQRGRSARGAVYSAIHLASQARVAVKVVALAHSDWRSAEQFERGARALQGIHHRAVPEVYGFECDDRHGKLVVVREYLDDETLEERVQRGWHADAAGFTTLLTELLELAAHLHGLVPTLLHRDIQPSNIMFRERTSWQPVLVDFDAMSGPERGDDTLHIAGTSAWAAPEQLAGAAVPASDLYSIGLTMVYVATHLEPEQLPTDLDGNLLLDDLLAGLEPRQRELVARLVVRDPAQRPPSASAALAELQGRTVMPAGAVPTYVAPAAMTPRELEQRIDGWLALGDDGNRDARLLVPYLARLDRIAYARYREPVARRGAIGVQMLDAAVGEAQRELSPRERKAHHRPPPQLPRQLARHRPPGSSGLGALLFVPVFVALIGVVVAFQAHRVASQLPSATGVPPRPGLLDVSDDGTPCGVGWLDVDDEPTRQCLYWVPARGAARLKLGCHEDPATVEAACTHIREAPGTAPDEHGVQQSMPIMRAAAEAGLVDGMVPPEGARALWGVGDEGPSSASPGASSGSGTSTPDAGAVDAGGDAEYVELELISTPPGARVEVDGQALCTTPCTATIPHGERPTFVVELDGYEPMRRRIYALSNKPVEFELKPR